MAMFYGTCAAAPRRETICHKCAGRCKHDVVKLGGRSSMRSGGREPTRRERVRKRRDSLRQVLSLPSLEKSVAESVHHGRRPGRNRTHPKFVGLGSTFPWVAGGGLRSAGAGDERFFKFSVSHRS